MNEKNKQDTGGGCSICGKYPCKNIHGTYWLCQSCEDEADALIRDTDLEMFGDEAEYFEGDIGNK